MNIVHLPQDILTYITNEFVSNIIPLSLVNKEFCEIAEERLTIERKRALAKKSFLVDKCKKGTDEGWVYNAFHGVTSIEECEFVREAYTPLHGFELMKRQARYTIGNTYQLAAESWTEFLLKYPIVNSRPVPTLG